MYVNEMFNYNTIQTTNITHNLQLKYYRSPVSRVTSLKGTNSFRLKQIKSPLDNNVVNTELLPFYLFLTTGALLNLVKHLRVYFDETIAVFPLSQNPSFNARMQKISDCKYFLQAHQS